ncbi:putative membrane protein [Acinetobacter baumannii 44327_2]|uniref:Putative membrane protein n=1 Tax=Acinetobacter baumannii 21072 TaxID=1310697 RepID=A0A062ILW3_ACIBA|nr:Hypothetical protein ABK1_0600 [Acinetobacter baumannii 1656-2]AGQ09166.1 hypothetical protein BJAB0868_00615 [Acinetobacter baumannii BJAB0868]AVN06229.1 putative membrane protein [Acinetobacter baumannii]EKL42874.1 hypothetical protein ACIN5180_0657 [Acinetobacter baumannii OIFC180]EKP55074.1 hypothetical protein ACINNAV2_0598 [Acinetobacter baumannii Naval-2]ELX03247.1 hypothetical protein ACIN7338_0649 [Acinetobacter baumannii OIFC338]ETQ44884.1 hypothetical protein P657_1312 [Acinetob
MEKACAYVSACLLFWEKLFNHIALYCLVWAVWVVADHKI